MNRLLLGAKAHLQPYSMLRKRKTTVNHMFASALAEVEAFSLNAVQDQLIRLGQSPDDPRCVYCGREATTWDHLFPTVRAGEYSGYGHTVANLVPSCSACNSSKGGKHWRSYVEQNSADPEAILGRLLPIAQKVEARMESAEDVRARDPVAYSDYLEIRAKILALMEQADALANRLRR